MRSDALGPPQYPVMKRTATLLVSLALLVPAASGAAYIKYEGLDGESKDSSHQDEIDVLSWSWGMTRERDGSVTLHEMLVNTSSPHGEFWFENLRPGEYAFEELRLGAGQGKMEFRVHDVSLASYRVTAEGSEVREEFAFYYNKISFGPVGNGTGRADVERTITFTGLE